MRVKDDGRISVRDAQAASTRARILEAAALVFETQGFSGARVEDIAAEAGVAVATVYKVFTNKRNLLVGAVRREMAGSDDDRGLQRQSWFAEQLDEPKPARQLQLIARNARRLNERAGRLLEVLQAAAPLDAELASECTTIVSDRIDRGRQTAQNLIRKARGRVRLRRDELAVTLAALTAPELFAAYRSAGRDGDAYERWLADVLKRVVLSTGLGE